MFLPVRIREGDKRASLVDATLGFVNPAKGLLREAERIFGGEAPISAFVSIGFGKHRINMNSESIDELVRNVLTNSERVHEELHSQLHESGIYHRFNVEWDINSDPEGIYAQISAYLETSAVSKAIDIAIADIRNRTPRAKLHDISQ